MSGFAPVTMMLPDFEIIHPNESETIRRVDWVYFFNGNVFRIGFYERRNGDFVAGLPMKFRGAGGNQ